MDMAQTLQGVAVSALPIIFAITLHEAAHGLVAYKLGDSTAKALGRITLNPLKHIDPVGTVLMPIMLYLLTNGNFVFGWARPVPVNPMYFKDPRKGMALTGAAGPGTNILIALGSLLLLKFGYLPFADALPASISEPVGLMLKANVWINVAFAALNLIPIPPLDGGRVAAGLLPRDMARSFERIEPYGTVIVVILLVTHMADYIILPIARGIVYLLSLFI